MFQNLVLSRSRERSEWWRAGFEGQSQADLASALILCFLMADQLCLAPSQQHCHKCEPTPLPWRTEPFQTVSPKQQQQQILPPPRLSCPNWLFTRRRPIETAAGGWHWRLYVCRFFPPSNEELRDETKTGVLEVHYKNMPHPRAAVLNLGVMTPLGVIYQIYCKYQIFTL